LCEPSFGVDVEAAHPIPRPGDATNLAGLATALTRILITGVMKGRRYRYYVSAALVTEAGTGSRAKLAARRPGDRRTHDRRISTARS
jgi:hypothetical protein